MTSILVIFQNHTSYSLQRWSLVVNYFFASIVIVPVFDTGFNAIKVSSYYAAWFTFSIKLAQNFFMFVVEISTSTLNLIHLVHSSYQLTMFIAFEVNSVKVSKFPLLLLANPEHAGVVEFLMILDFGNASIVKHYLGFLVLYLVLHVFECFYQSPVCLFDRFRLFGMSKVKVSSVDQTHKQLDFVC